MKKSTMMNDLKELGLTRYQSEQILREVLDLLSLNETNSDTYPDHCPKCGDLDSKFIKKGTNTGKQRYQCKECMAVFVWDVGKLTYCSQVKQDKWNIVIQDTLNLVSILDTAAKANLSSFTVFRMRHKFLLALEIMISKNELSGVIECDDTFLLESNKGSKIEDRKARKRQSPSTKRGLSHEQICIIVATNRNGTEFASVIDRGKPSANAMITGLKHHIRDRSTLITDGLKSFNKLVTYKACNHYILSGFKSYDNLIHLNTVNSLHSTFKDMIRTYRGVATKYLNRYCALLVFVRKYMQMDNEEKLTIMLNALKLNGIYSRTKDLNKKMIVKFEI